MATDPVKGRINEAKGKAKKAAGKATGTRRQHQAKAGLEQGEEVVKEIASTIDEKVHKNPWPYLGGTALGFLVIGLLLNRHKK